MADILSYENFLEATARLLSTLLTDKEAESVVSGFTNFHLKLKRLSSENLRSLALEAAKRKPKPTCNHHGKSCSQNCIRGFLKAFTVGYLIKYALGVAPALLTGRVFKDPSVLRRELGSDTVSFALFLSTFTSTYKAILCVMRRLRTPDVRKRRDKGDRLNAFVAGTLAGLCLTLEKNRSRRTAIALYLLVRSLQFGSVWTINQWTHWRHDKRRERILRNHHRLHEEFEDDFGVGLNSPGNKDLLMKRAEMKKVTVGDHVDGFLRRWAGTLVMMVSSSQILFAFLCMPDTLPRSYLEFLYTQSGMRVHEGLTRPLMRAMGGIAHELSASKDPELIRIPEGKTSAEFVAQNISPNLAILFPNGVRHEHIMCAMEHPKIEKCEPAHAATWVRGFGTSLRLYGPLNAVLLVLFRGKKILRNPARTAATYVFTTLRSSFFLSTYVMVAWLVPCWLRRLLRREKLMFYFLNGLCSGLTVLIESPPKRLELGLYCLPRALESAWKCGIEWGWLRNVPGGEVLYFALSMGVLMTLYQTEPDTIDDSYRTLMVRIFGAN